MYATVFVYVKYNISMLRKIPLPLEIHKMSELAALHSNYDDLYVM